MTTDGGKQGAGIAYKASQTNGAWMAKVLHYFASGSDGAEHLGGLVIGKGGALYGTTSLGGSGSCNGGCGTMICIARSVQV